MRIDIAPPSNAYEVVTQRWGLQNAKQILQTYRSTVYHVESPQGPAKLKLYTQIGYRGERTAISFSKKVGSSGIAQIYQSDFYRAAVLSEWLEGPTVGEIVRKGDYETATRMACDVIQGLSESNSPSFPFAYRRKAAITYRFLRQKSMKGRDPEIRALAKEAMTALGRFLARRSDERIIHGDLHYDNMIQTAVGPRAIDPRGVKSHPVMNCKVLFIHSGEDVPLSSLSSVFSDQVRIITENLGYDRDLVMHCALFSWLLRIVRMKDNQPALREKRLREVEVIRNVIAQA